MNKRKNYNTTPLQRKFISIEDARAVYGLGRASLLKVADAAQATVRIGRRRLINVAKLDEALEEAVK